MHAYKNNRFIVDRNQRPNNSVPADETCKVNSFSGHDNKTVSASSSNEIYRGNFSRQDMNNSMIVQCYEMNFFLNRATGGNVKMLSEFFSRQHSSLILYRTIFINYFSFHKF